MTVVDSNAWYYWPENEPLVKNFAWVRDRTPASSYTFVAASVVGYPMAVLALQFLLRGRKKPVPLGYFPALHNLVLCLGSLIMFVGAIQALLLESEENSWLWANQGKYRWLLCLPAGIKPVGRTFFWSYIYYLSKFYELIDTLILVLKKKKLNFLHVYHHSLVILMSYLWLQGQQSLQTVGLLANTGIHVLMYFYYMMHSLGYPPPWRKFVTNSQIVQFLFSFGVSIPMCYYHFTTKGGCAGFPAWVYNVIFNFTLLLLFTNFHRQQYGKTKARSGEARTKKE